MPVVRKIYQELLTMFFKNIGYLRVFIK